MSNLELRRDALLASGWKWAMKFAYSETEYWLIPPDEQHAFKPDYLLTQAELPKDAILHLSLRTPAVEDDPGESEPWFLEWCEKNGFQWQLNTCNPHDGFEAVHVVAWIYNSENDMDFEAEADTPSLARAKAVIQASLKSVGVEIPE